MTTDKIKYLTLFSNSGIGEFYLKELGVEAAVANEIDKNRCKLYKHFYPETDMVQGDINDPDVQRELIEKYQQYNCSMIMCSPVCRAFSTANTLGDKKNDPRKNLIIPSLYIIEKCLPDTLMIENVQGFLKAKLMIDGKEITIENLIRSRLEPLGYKLTIGVLNAADYGTGQTRKRAIILGSRVGKWNFPEKDKKQITVREVIGHLPSLEAGEKSWIPFHNAPSLPSRHIIALKHTPTGYGAQENAVYFPKKVDGTRVKSFKTSYSRIWWDRPAPCITTNNGNWGSQQTGHPGRLKPDGTYSDCRVLTLLEVILLAGLPADYPVPNWISENQMRRSLGEMFCPLLVKRLVEKMPRKIS